jgi:hypothetical protein
MVDRYSNAISEHPHTHQLSEGGTKPHDAYHYSIPPTSGHRPTNLNQDIHPPIHQSEGAAHSHHRRAENSGPLTPLPFLDLPILHVPAISPKPLTSKPISTRPSWQTKPGSPSPKTTHDQATHPRKARTKPSVHFPSPVPTRQTWIPPFTSSRLVARAEHKKHDIITFRRTRTRERAKATRVIQHKQITAQDHSAN